jgi:tRNA(Arg) A34 adenosine deaminase TadA
MFKHILELALALASTKAVDDGNCRHACVIFDKKGNVISTGWNLSKYENNNAGRYHEYAHWHAETLAIYRLPKTTKSLYLLSIRINKRGELRQAKPCPECAALIMKQNILDIYYSDCLGQIIKQVIK